MACGDDQQEGCNGGSAFRAWEFTMTNGIVTGGKYNSKEVPVDDNRHILWRRTGRTRVHVERIFLSNRVANRTGGDRVTITALAE